MKSFAKILNYFITGVGFGATAYLCILAFVYPGAVPTIKGVISVLTISGFIGLFSMIFNTDLPITISFIIHLVIVFGAFLLMVKINNWQIDLLSISIFIITYVVIWLICLLQQFRTIKKINEKIKQRNLK